MKKITLMAIVMLVSSQAVNALTFNGDVNRRFSFDQPAMFVERGITFYVFPDGTFDFNTQPSTNTGIYYRHKPTTYGAPVTMEDNGVRIEHDAGGRVRRVGSVFMNYDYANRIKRIGSVYMTYHRNRLVQIGGMRILYDRRGQVAGTAGVVKGYENYNVYANSWNNNFAPAPLNEGFYYYRYDGTKVRID